jgi:hypothetical protein
LELSIHLKNAMNLPAQAKCQSYWFKKTNFYKPSEKLERKIYDASIITANWPWNKEMQSVIKF